jgi:hypothetical protein
VGASKIAGIQGLGQTALTRCVLVPCAALLLPPILSQVVRTAKLMPRSKHGALLLELALIYGSMQLAMPASLAVYPQVSAYMHASCLGV